MSETTTLTPDTTYADAIVAIEAEAYRKGFANGYMKAKAEIAAKPKPPRATTERKLAEDTAKAQAAIESLERWQPDSWTAAKPEILQEAVNSEIARLHRAITDHAPLWRIYRRKDKGPSYVAEVQQ